MQTWETGTQGNAYKIIKSLSGEIIAKIIAKDFLTALKFYNQTGFRFGGYELIDENERGIK